MPETSTTSRERPGRRFRALAGFAVLLGIAGYLVTQYVMGGAGPARCTVRAAVGGGEDGGDGGKAEYEVPPAQAANAATIEAVASVRQLPEQAVTIALATAMQESGLRNLSHGDRDSLGLFQQRPSQGWGTEEQILDPVYSAGKFYDHLVKIPDYTELPLTVAAQKVQRSGYPDAYAKHETNASLLTAALTGRRAAALNCTTGPEGVSGPGDLAEVREKLMRDFGEDVLTAPGSEAAGAEDGGAGSGGGRSKRPTDLAIPAGGKQRGWELAHWAVAHSAELRIERISYAGRVWSAGLSEDGWRESEEPGAGGSAVVLRLATAAQS
ncbi:hypothetical protein LHJ74_18815 [Streptomyces sp. N2-109]|uniref:ARB-07466-like C-terminal domain-containing protein n=1 Tax=Streptomyces gossypii TaxID=2883101 RepID=A0ABT2JVJ5_9ACTN|nr:hypothetical protein [Streptomyces gossypii]MCT2591927.1 hypothetical protein [Streptomyces gossypii]